MPGFWGPDPPGDLPEKSVLILYGMGGYPGPPLGGVPYSGTPPTLVRDPPYPGPGPPLGGGYPGGPWGGTLGYPGGCPPTLVWVPPYPCPGPPYPTLGTPLPWSGTPLPYPGYPPTLGTPLGGPGGTPLPWSGGPPYP